MKTYQISCNNCGHDWTEESDFELTYEDCTCPKCGTYEDLHLEQQDQEDDNV